MFLFPEIWDTLKLKKKYILVPQISKDVFLVHETPDNINKMVTCCSKHNMCQMLGVPHHFR